MTEKSSDASSHPDFPVKSQLNALGKPHDAEAISISDVRLRSLHRALRRTRAILYTAMMDGTIKKTLWANAREELLAYLDRVIAAGLDMEDGEVLKAGHAADELPVSIADLIADPSQLYALYLEEK